MFYWDQPGFLVGWVALVLSCFNGEKPSSVGLVDKLFQPASSQVETVEKAFVLLCRVIVARVRAIRRSYRVSTENGWKSVLLRNVNRINPSQLQLKRLIPIKHDLSEELIATLAVCITVFVFQGRVKIALLQS